MNYHQSLSGCSSYATSIGPSTISVSGTNTELHGYSVLQTQPHSSCLFGKDQPAVYAQPPPRPLRQYAPGPKHPQLYAAIFRAWRGAECQSPSSISSEYTRRGRPGNLLRNRWMRGSSRRYRTRSIRYSKRSNYEKSDEEILGHDPTWGFYAFVTDYSPDTPEKIPHDLFGYIERFRVERIKQSRLHP